MSTSTISQLSSASPPISGGEIIEIERANDNFKISLNTLKNWIAEFVQNQITLTAEWQYDDSTSSSDPGGGKFRLNNSNQSSATNIYVNDETENGIDFGRIISSLTSNSKIYIQEKEDSQRALLFDVSGTPTDNGGWWTIPITNGEASSQSIEDGKKCGFIFNIS